MGGIGPMEIVLIVLVILIFFGAKRLPELARGLGKGIREFRGAISDTTDKLKNEIQNPPTDNKSSGDAGNSGASSSQEPPTTPPSTPPSTPS
ncbi:twin-arginine translocase TatA/TatE family subunit [Gemmatimonas aurantiaca]|nr:twin-arginine translocase TatA/TatE family subunit [Gemmatimonas aurantiaca]